MKWRRSFEFRVDRWCLGLFYLQVVYKGTKTILKKEEKHFLGIMEEITW
jgi:hypothetical protein